MRLPLPMKATAGELPAGPDWLHEIKWDGMRAVVGAEPGSVTIASSTGKDATARFPELARLGDALGVPAVLDGELVALDDDGRPSFGRLQPRMQAGSEARIRDLVAAVPIAFCAFDLLILDGRELYEVPTADRRRLLGDVLVDGPHWRVSAEHDDGAALLEAARAQRLEGVVSKRRSARYQPGRRTTDWVKVKVRLDQEFVVGGWSGGEGARRATLGSLLLGYWEDGRLRFAGKVGTGFTDADLRSWAERLRPRAADVCPFDPVPERDMAASAHWCRPELVAQVTFGEWTGTDSPRLRHPSYIGERHDVDPGQVTRRP